MKQNIYNSVSKYDDFDWLGRKDLFQLFPGELGKDDNLEHEIQELRELLDNSEALNA